MTKRQEYFTWLKKTAEEEKISEFLVSFNHPYQEPAGELITESDVAASDTDTAVYVLSRNSGEGADRYCEEGDYLLFPEEKSNLELLGRSYKKVILVLNIGGVMDLSEIQKISGINALVLLSQLGNISGLVLGDILTGAVNPSGKLVDTWAKSYQDYPSSAEFSHNDNNVDDEYYKEGIYVGYRYFDSFDVEPLYPFGFGRSYTDFSIDIKNISRKDAKIILDVAVKNTGDTYSGKEVVQVYYQAPAGELAKPYQELIAFAKTQEIRPQEACALQLSFDLKDLASYSEKEAAWMIEAGNYTILVGNSSRNTKAAAVITIQETIKTEILKNLFQMETAVEEISAPPVRATEVSGDVPVIILEHAAKLIHTEKTVYTIQRPNCTTRKKQMLTLSDIKAGNCTVEELVAQLTVEELAEFCVGTLRADDGTIVGNASDTVPGAAGDTTSLLKESRGIKSMILADGPAGLRLQPVFKTTLEGERIPGGDILGDVRQPFPDDLNEEEVITYYQYCTAIPIGWALAQSWNMSLLEEVGDMVGQEMEKFGVDLWLAPALNIHRNPLCGRNFEYYSEDPLVSGKAAAAITNGVQRHAGKGTTIKHFAANNQEDNRYFTNSCINERALREIYLKGFEIAVRESQPLSIMTSYNLLNGVHTANSYDLLQSAARDEWGFEGMFMTDWFTSQEVPGLTGSRIPLYPISASTGCIFAGNDVQMPGCRKNVDDIIRAVKTGEEIDGYTITMADLQFCAAKVIGTVAKTK
jgi:beta-glucosidase